MENKFMNEGIRKDIEIKEEELEQVSGGYWGDEYAPNCPNCNVKMVTLYDGILPFYSCASCGHKIEIAP